MIKKFSGVPSRFSGRRKDAWGGATVGERRRNQTGGVKGKREECVRRAAFPVWEAKSSQNCTFPRSELLSYHACSDYFI